MTPRASFVIPAYNAECWISKAINSCLKQSIKLIEVVVVNDGSKDGTREIINALAAKDKRVVPVHLDQNVGRSEARNIGNRKAASEIIMVLDADDMAMRDRAKQTVGFFEIRKPDVIWGAFYPINALGFPTLQHPIPAGPFDHVVSREKKLNFICHSTMAYRKGVTLNVQYDTGEYSKLGLDDWKFQWDCFKKGYLMRHIRQPLSYYRDISAGISKTRDQKAVDALKEAYFGVAV